MAREQHLPLSVYGGGHGVTGSAVVDAGICVDLREMRAIDVNPDARTAQVGGGCTWGEVDAATQQHGLAFTGGRMSSGGSGGITDGGVRDSAVDGPVDAPGPDLPPSTPGTLVCGAQTCDVKTQTCCVSLAVGSVGARCVPIGTACTGAALVCDEPADCPGAVCCFGVQTGGGGLGVGSQCSARTACNGFGRFLVCRTNADCGGTMPACCSVAGVPVCQTACLGS
jgi:hypothetical protein